MAPVRTATSMLLLLVLFHNSAYPAIDKEPFEQIIHLLQALYEPDFLEQHHRLRILGQWDDGRVEASARREEDQSGQLAVITITGGLARHPRITEGALALVVCHEIGHFLAGQPAIRNYSTEGQSDYFAASACMRRLLQYLPRDRRPGDQGAPHLVVQRCTSAFQHTDLRESCIQITMSGYALSAFLADRKRTLTPRFETPEADRVNVIGFGTPTVQCRLDTFSAAALCNPGPRNSTRDDRSWLCTGNGSQAGAARPSCWYPPTAGR